MADLELNSIGNGDGNNYLLRDNTKIPLSGSNQISGSLIPSTDGTVNLGSSGHSFNIIYGSRVVMNNIHGVTDYLGLYSMTAATQNWWRHGAGIDLYSENYTDNAGGFNIFAAKDGTQKVLQGKPNGTLTWNGQAIQTTSDQRLKQQITQIDNALLDAWEDVNPVQFKYNEAVKEKGDNARLHTGYVVQQINEACQKHDVDISSYGLYCHEEYAEETEEVEVEQKDGTKTKERKVIREASEHYSLRYTETLVVECAYLRRENNKLKQQMQQYTESLSKFEERLKALEHTSK